MQQRIAQALEGTDVVAAYLFGSRQQDRARSDSDTDVAVVLPRGAKANLAVIGELTLRLEDAGVPRPDLHVLNESPLAFAAEALAGERVFTGDDDARVEYEAWLTTRYLDFEPVLELQYRIQRHRLATEGTLGRPRRHRSQAHAA